MEKEKFPFSPLPYSADAAALEILSVRAEPRKVSPIDPIVKDNSPFCVFFICEETSHPSLLGFTQYWTSRDGNNRENSFRVSAGIEGTYPRLHPLILMEYSS